MNKFIDISGQTFGRLTVIRYIGKAKDRHSIWLCRCVCGTFKNCKSNDMKIKNGGVKSCGCLKSENIKKANTKHGHSINHTTSPEYQSWNAMLDRTTNKNNRNYHNYGGRGIGIDDNRWLQFEYFLSDMGTKPKGLTLERIDNNKGYSKANCRWASMKDQANNKRSNHILTYNNKSQSISRWADDLKIDRKLICQRLKHNWSIEDALTKPVVR